MMQETIDARKTPCGKTAKRSSGFIGWSNGDSMNRPIEHSSKAFVNMFIK